MNSSRLFCSGVPVSRSLLLACSNTITGLCESLGQGLSMTGPVQRLTVQLTQALQAQRHHNHYTLQYCKFVHVITHCIYLLTLHNIKHTLSTCTHAQYYQPCTEAHYDCDHTCIFMRCVYRSEFMFLSICPSSSTRQSRESFLKNFLSSA